MKQSAGILFFRRTQGQLQFFLVHPGGPYFAKKNAGWWTVPKGELGADEDMVDAALREFKEETGHKLSGQLIPLQPIMQKGGKQVHCWAIEGDLDESAIVSNTFQLEWPPRSGKQQLFPEIDKGGWFAAEEAMTLINERQAAFLTELMDKVK